MSVSTDDSIAAATLLPDAADADAAGTSPTSASPTEVNVEVAAAASAPDVVLDRGLGSINAPQHNFGIFSSPRLSAERVDFLRTLKPFQPGGFMQAELTAAAAAAAEGGSSRRDEALPSSGLDSPYTGGLYGWRGWLGALLADADAFLSGAVLPRAGFLDVRGRAVLAIEGARGALRFATPQHYTPGLPLFGSREVTLEQLLRRVRIVLIAWLLILLVAWPAVIAPGLETSYYYDILARWFVEFLATAVLGIEARDTLIAVASMSVITMAVCCLSLFSLLISKQVVALALDIKPKQLPSVLRLLLSPHTPTTMVSYTWSSVESTEAARSLAYALPDTWIDIKHLSSGFNIQDQTVGIAHTCEAMVLFVTGEYLQSRACLRELMAAVLHRRADAQVTIVMAMGVEGGYLGAKAGTEVYAAIEAMRKAGFLVAYTGVDLLQYLRQHVYATTSKATLKRVIKFMARHAEPVVHMQRHLRLPAARASRQQPLEALAGAWVLPPGSVHSGIKYIAGDLSHIGTRFVFNMEHALLAAALAFAAAFIATAAVAIANNDPFVTWYSIAGCIIVVIIVIFFAFIILPALVVDLDPRNTHSPMLLPLNAAAFCNSARFKSDTDHADAGVVAAGFSVRIFMWRDDTTPSTGLLDEDLARAKFTADKIAMPGVSKPPHDAYLPADASSRAAKVSPITLYERMLVFTRFLQDEVGVSARMVDITEDPELEGRRISLQKLVGSEEDDAQAHVDVYVIEDAITARTWLEEVQPDINRTSIIVTHAQLFSVSSERDGVTRRLGDYCCIVLGDKQGLDKTAPYAGLAAALVDNIGSRVGGALVAAFKHRFVINH